jgi:hypothetical protein
MQPADFSSQKQKHAGGNLQKLHTPPHFEQKIGVFTKKKNVSISRDSSVQVSPYSGWAGALISALSPFRKRQRCKW